MTAPSWLPSQESELIQLIVMICVNSRLGERFRERFMRLAGPKNSRRFVDLCQSYTECVAREAELRERGIVLGLESFIPLRRNNSAVLLCFALAEYILGIDLDDDVYEDDTFAEAYWAACDHVCWANVSLLCLNSKVFSF